MLTNFRQPECHDVVSCENLTARRTFVGVFSCVSAKMHLQTRLPLKLFIARRRNTPLSVRGFVTHQESYFRERLTTQLAHSPHVSAFLRHSSRLTSPRQNYMGSGLPKNSS